MLAPVYTKEDLRLLEAADLVENSDTFNMNWWLYTCGSPACVLGHYALAHPDRWKIHPEYFYPFLEEDKESDYPSMSSAVSEFGLSLTECKDLFSGVGCGFAKTGAEAATFIRNFVSQRVRARLQEP